jgi:type IV secretion system protein VirB10
MSATGDNSFSGVDGGNGVDATIDPHRFSAEPRRRPNRTVLLIVALFLVLMALIGGSVLITKRYVADYLVGRTAQRKEEKAIKETAEETSRKGKVFGAAASAPAALPAALAGSVAGGGAADLAGANELAKAIPVIRSSNPAGAASAGADAAPAPPALMLPSGAPAQGGGGAAAAPPRTVEQLAGAQASTAPLTATVQASAASLGNRSLLLARGSFIPCVLETQLVSNLGGSATCIVPQHVYSDDGKVLLIEKGSSIVGIYQSNVRTGDSRIAILWQRIKTANGIVVDVDSGAADQLGVAGAPGILDNHWPERIGAAFLLSLVEDGVAIEVAKHSQGQGGTANGASTVASTTALSGKVLDATINIPPTLYKNRGDRLMVFVNRDLWFNRVYALRQR